MEILRLSRHSTQMGLNMSALDRLIPVLSAYGAQLISQQYAGYHKPIYFVCACGSTHHALFSNLLRGKQVPRCRECGIQWLKNNPSKRKYSAESISQLLSRDGAELIEADLRSVFNPVTYRCRCGEIYSKVIHNIETGQPAFCQRCSLENRPRGLRHPRYRIDLTDEDQAEWKARP